MIGLRSTVRRPSVAITLIGLVSLGVVIGASAPSVEAATVSADAIVAGTEYAGTPDGAAEHLVFGIARALVALLVGVTNAAAVLGFEYRDWVAPWLIQYVGAAGMLGVLARTVLDLGRQVVR